MLFQSYKFSHSHFLDSFLQVWLIRNQTDEVTTFRYVNQSDEVSNVLEEGKC